VSAGGFSNKGRENKNKNKQIQKELGGTARNTIYKATKYLFCQINFMPF